MLKFYGYKKCSTCRKAEKWLESQSIEYRFVDITEVVPSSAELKKALKALKEKDGSLKNLFNTSGVQYRELKIKDKLPNLSEAEAIELLSGNGKLVKRPLVLEGNACTVGFKEDVYKETWG
jgi:Spx/MgsR family transcriptional regulator